MGLARTSCPASEVDAFERAGQRHESAVSSERRHRRTRVVPQTCALRTALVLVSALTAGVVTGCGTGSAPQTSTARSLVETPRSVVVSVGHSPRSLLSPRLRLGEIDLKRVVLRTDSEGLVATFTTYDSLRRAWMKNPSACGQVGIYLQSQHLEITSSPNAETDPGDTAVAHSQLEVRYVSNHVVRLKVPLAALGSHFSQTEPWDGYALGYTCPPGDQQEDNTEVVNPRS
jgi:hypothetical protein